MRNITSLSRIAAGSFLTMVVALGATVFFVSSAYAQETTSLTCRSTCGSNTCYLKHVTEGPAEGDVYCPAEDGNCDGANCSTCKCTKVYSEPSQTLVDCDCAG